MARTAARRGVGFMVAIAVVLLPGFANPLPVAAAGGGTLFGFTGIGTVVAIDPSAGSVTQLANLFTPNAQSFPGVLADDPSTHRLFAARDVVTDQTVFPPVTAEEMVTIDSRTGAVSTSPFLNHPVGPLAFDPATGSLFGVTSDCCSPELVLVDPVTGAETNLASIPGDAFSAFAPAPALHTLYLISESFATFPATSQLISINTQNDSVAFGPVLNAGARGLVYDTSSATLFGTTFCCPAHFVQIDPNTGIETQLGSYDFGFFLEPGIAIDSATHTVFVTQDVFDPMLGPITHIASINDQTGGGVLGPGARTNITIVGLYFESANITPDTIRADVRSALASGAIDNAGVATALLSQLNAAAAARAAGHCSTAANIYTAFINAVGASGRHIASATATQLVTEAQFLIANCP